jgi:hypothetical protein
MKELGDGEKMGIVGKIDWGSIDLVYHYLSINLKE